MRKSTPRLLRQRQRRQLLRPDLWSPLSLSLSLSVCVCDASCCLRHGWSGQWGVICCPPRLTGALLTKDHPCARYAASETKRFLQLSLERNILYPEVGWVKVYHVPEGKLGSVAHLFLLGRWARIARKWIILSLTPYFLYNVYFYFSLAVCVDFHGVTLVSYV